MDIGAGTGLLSLMLAQQLHTATITATELDGDAARQAAENMAISPWAVRICVITGDVKELPVRVPYDFIITNPPFYEADLKSNDQLRNQAMHATTLNYASLLEVIDNHLQTEGAFSILLPYQPFKNFTAKAADAGFHAEQILHIKQSDQHDYFRSVGIFKRREGVTHIAEMSIRETCNIYSPAFIDLLKPYYLHL
jgi:tRNA1Val (adenine37-N6)-methyltransferase